MFQNQIRYYQNCSHLLHFHSHLFLKRSTLLQKILSNFHGFSKLFYQWTFRFPFYSCLFDTFLYHLLSISLLFQLLSNNFRLFYTRSRLIGSFPLLPLTVANIKSAGIKCETLSADHKWWIVAQSMIQQYRPAVLYLMLWAGIL